MYTLYAANSKLGTIRNIFESLEKGCSLRDLPNEMTKNKSYKPFANSDKYAA